ncbi:Sas10 C-terminal domain-domain-containing protein [Absidia repens]|uniref:Sas10 C-terminal domain-domain-containing protein n=1 Tax=Absidia repens TaxID=90262 RepID=A0A1X2ISV6_9FUNG|nr:Sas10 C-terminal domain-domain-containing protein [Absidia repens]
MGKKKSTVFRKGSNKQSDVSDGKINAIKTWDDIEHDSEDDFHEARGNILLDGKESDEDDQSEHEIYGLDGLDSQPDSSSEEEDVEAEQDDSTDATTWGTSKKAYYNADEGSDLDEMREEEEEALKIQKQRLADMDEADFVDDTLSGWGIGAEANKEVDRQMVENVTKELDDISFDMSSSVAARRKNLPVVEKIKILQNESPELLDLLNEFKDKTSTMGELKQMVDQISDNNKQDHEAAKFILFQYQLLMNYLTNISFYFSLKAAGANNIRNHPVIGALVELRAAIEKMEKLEKKLQPQLIDFIEHIDETAENTDSKHMKTATITKAKKSSNKKVILNQQQSSDEEEYELDFDDDGAFSDDDIQQDATDIEKEFKSLKKQAKKRKRNMNDNDFGDLDMMEQVDMEDKLAKKRSIRDYVSKIESKQARQQSKYQGDSDLPYKERNLRQKKGVAQPQDKSADLDDQEWNEQDALDATDAWVEDGDTGDQDDYSKAAKKIANKKANKQAAYDATRAPVMDSNYVVEDGHKRLASWQILKNKGLTPHRKKENRNGRVKKRHQYEQKMKKLSSVRQVVKPLAGTYGGESTGIRSNVSRSVKL